MNEFKNSGGHHWRSQMFQKPVMLKRWLRRHSMPLGRYTCCATMRVSLPVLPSGKAP